MYILLLWRSDKKPKKLEKEKSLESLSKDAFKVCYLMDNNQGIRKHRNDCQLKFSILSWRLFTFEVCSLTDKKPRKLEKHKMRKHRNDCQLKFSILTKWPCMEIVYL